jgi:hypothetical protein
MLAMLNAAPSAAWTAGVRQALYKAFSSSMLVYGFGLYAHEQRFRGVTRTNTQHMDAMTAVYNEGLRFVFGQDPRPTTVLASMANMPTPLMQLKYAAARFTKHLLDADRDNPVVSAAARLRRPFNSDSLPSLVLECMHHPIVSWWRADNAGRDPDAQRSLRVFIRDRMHATWNEAMLAKYITKVSRSPTSRIDLTLHLSDPECFARAVLWRRNRLVNPTQRCLICLRPWNRKTVGLCLEAHAPLIFEFYIWTTYRAHQEQWHEAHPDFDKQLYSIFDYLVNSQDSKNFLKATDWVSAFHVKP